MEEHYKILGLDFSATVDDVNAAFRRRAAETHPDKNKSPDAASEFRRIVEARIQILDYLSAKPTNTTAEDTQPDTSSPHQAGQTSPPQPNVHIHSRSVLYWIKHWFGFPETNQEQTTNVPDSTESTLWVAFVRQFYAVPWSIVFCCILAFIILSRIFGLR